MAGSNVLPAEAIRWMTVWSEARVLTLDGSSAVARRVAAEGHTVFAISSTEAGITRLRAHQGLTPVWARPEAIPLDPCQFDVVMTHQGFHRLDTDLALAEIARVLRPGGCLAASYVIRDDSVPWVRRLAALLRHYDPMAMKGDFGHEALTVLDGSKYFPEVERRGFRIWQPITLEALQELVARQPLSANLNERQRDRLAEEVTALFNASVRPGETLRLPFQLLCCRAWVSHEELTAPVALPDEGISIRM